jgi:hypothetical protein
MNYNEVSIRRDPLSNDKYIKYLVYCQGREVYSSNIVPVPVGQVVFEKHGDTYHLELMNISYPDKGIGTKSISLILEDIDMKACNITVNAINDKSRVFFERQHFICI